MQTVFDFAAKRAELSPDAIAFEEAETGRRLTYAAFNARAERCAAALERLGIAPGERIAILCHNSATFFEVLFGCGKAASFSAAHLRQRRRSWRHPRRLRRPPAPARCRHSRLGRRAGRTATGIRLIAFEAY